MVFAPQVRTVRKHRRVGTGGAILNSYSPAQSISCPRSTSARGEKVTLSWKFRRLMVGVAG